MIFANYFLTQVGLKCAFKGLGFRELSIPKKDQALEIHLIAWLLLCVSANKVWQVCLTVLRIVSTYIGLSLSSPMMVPRYSRGSLTKPQYTISSIPVTCSFWSVAERLWDLSIALLPESIVSILGRLWIYSGRAWIKLETRIEYVKTPSG